ncbi:hypothetical protein EON82_02885 [bacterium]|nr:MAG: hypothetical protein EON82_02885 [bacterium]
MSQITQKIDLLGRREATTLPANTTQRVFASLAIAAPGQRQVVSITNCDAAAELWLTLAAPGASAPTVSSSDCDLIVSPRSTRQLQIGPGLEVWLRSSAASSSVSYTALEMQ